MADDKQTPPKDKGATSKTQLMPGQDAEMARVARMGRQYDPVRVTNHEKRLIILPDLVADKGDPEAAIPPRILEGPRLIPGGNNIDGEYAELAQRHPHVMHKVKHKEISFGGDTDEPEGPGKPASLSDVTVALATVLIKDETDRDVLKGWIESERRPEVVQLINRRLGELASR